MGRDQYTQAQQQPSSVLIAASPFSYILKKELILEYLMSCFFMTTEINWEMGVTGREGQKPEQHWAA